MVGKTLGNMLLLPTCSICTKNPQGMHCAEEGRLSQLLIKIVTDIKLCFTKFFFHFFFGCNNQVLRVGDRQQARFLSILYDVHRYNLWQSQRSNLLDNAFHVMPVNERSATQHGMASQRAWIFLMTLR